MYYDNKVTIIYFISIFVLGFILSLLLCNLINNISIYKKYFENNTRFKNIYSFYFYVILMTFYLCFNKNNTINSKVIIISISFNYCELIANKMLSTTKNDCIVPATFTVFFFTFSSI